MMMMMVSITMALPASDKTPGETNDLMATIYKDCVRTESVNCIKYKVFAFVDKMLTDKDDITLSEGITVVKTSTAEEGAPRSIEGSDVDSLLFDRLGRFLKTHTIKVDLKGTDILGVVESAGRSLEEISDNMTTVEGRGKKKKTQKILMPMMMALGLKAAALLPLALGAIALIAGKALLVGKIALVISAIIGLKKLFGGQQKHVTYEVVAHPHHSSSSSHAVSHDDGGHGGGFSGGVGGGDFGGGYGGGGGSGSSGHGWARSLPQDVKANAQRLAYSGQMPEAQS
ncbi:hypothetical protein PV328_003529 [Microctonus aethiopoides]|uniref:Osiris 7 n=1 Tax=Microctonus aethiopoides TaxID=144406 RepID=A0AA39KKR5_9HYME|nr:hypothetical protein PV328_003529 [Microctonus aethiopoides]